MLPPTHSADSAPISVILNPAARSARAARRIGKIRALSPRLHICETKAAGDAQRFARELAEQGASVVVAAGGDGTMNEVVHGLAEAAVEARPALGLLPTGTMNVLARELGLPVGDLEACWRVVERGRTRPIDLWRAGDRFFAQMAGVGIDAAIIRETTWEAKRKLGPLSYALSTLRILGRPAPRLTIRPEGAPALEGTGVLLGNGRLYAGPFAAFPEATNNDGLLDVLVIHRHGLSEAASLLVDILDGRQSEGDKSVTRFRTTNLTVESAEGVPFEIDGELAGTVPVEFHRADFPLRVIV